MHTIQGHWTDLGSVNTPQYYANRIAGMSREDAARNTWTGRIATDYGFTNVEVEESAIAIAPRFSRPGVVTDPERAPTAIRKALRQLEEELRQRELLPFGPLGTLIIKAPGLPSSDAPANETRPNEQHPIGPDAAVPER